MFRDFFDSFPSLLFACVFFKETNLLIFKKKKFMGLLTAKYLARDVVPSEHEDLEAMEAGKGGGEAAGEGIAVQVEGLEVDEAEESEQPGKPADRGKPAERGKSAGRGKPAGAGKPNDAGGP